MENVMVDETRCHGARRQFIKSAGVVGIASVAGCLGGSSSEGGDFPSRNIEVVVGYGAGGGTDTLHRALADPAQEIIQEDYSGVEVTVSNITGAASMNAANQVLNQPADGYTLWGNTNGIARNIVDGNADFTIDDWSFLLQVQHDTSWMYSSGREGNGVSDIDTLIEQMESEEDPQIGVVGAVESAVFLLQWTNALDLLDGYTIVAYDDAGQMTNDVITGEIDAAIGEIQELEEQYQAGDVSLLLIGVEDDVQVEEYSDVPTVSDIGAPEATYGVRRGVVLKSGVSEDRQEYLHDVWREAMDSKRYQELAEESLVTIRGEGYLPGDEYQAAAEELVGIFEEMNELADQVQTE